MNNNHQRFQVTNGYNVTAFTLHNKSVTGDAVKTNSNIQAHRF